MSDSNIEVPLIPECSACILSSLQTMIPLLAKEKDKQYELVTLAYRRISEGYEENKDPATLSIELYQELCTVAGVMDPYQGLKKQSTEAALRALPVIEKIIDCQDGYKRLRAVIAAAISGNTIDYNTAGHEPDLERLADGFSSVLDEGFAIDFTEDLWILLKSRRGQVAYLADNAGETVFDIPFVRFLKELGWKAYYIVKGQPMINDAVRGDIEGLELESIAEVRDTGAWAHGTPRQWVSHEFIELISEMDLVISKGQANIETFPEIQRNLAVETYYITRAKCPHISAAIGAKKGDNVVLKRPVGL